MKNNHGFTLLEIVIAIALIAIFVTLPILAYTNYLKKTRDTQRKNSINQIQAALEQYKANKDKYPDKINWEDTLVSGGYLPSIPTDPFNGQPVPGEAGLYYGFDYTPSTDGQSYQLAAILEENQPGGMGNANEISYYVVGPEGPKIVHTTPGAATPLAGLPTNTPIPSTTILPTSFHTPTPTSTPTNTPTQTPTPTNTLTPSPTPRYCWGTNGSCNPSCDTLGVAGITPVLAYSSCSPATYNACWNQGGVECANSNVGDRYTTKYSTPSCSGTVFGYFMSGTECANSSTGHCYRGSTQFHVYTFPSAGNGSDKDVPANSCSAYSYGAGGQAAYTDTNQPQECTYSAAPGCPVKTYGPSGSAQTKYTWSGSSCSVNGTGGCYILSGSNYYVVSGGVAGCGTQQLADSYTQCQWIQY